MSTDEETIKRRYREFLDLLPLTVAIAGLPVSESSRSYTGEQMEARARALANARSPEGQCCDQWSIAGLVA